MPPELEAGLLAQALAEGLPLQQYVVQRLLLDQFSGVAPVARAASGRESVKGVPKTQPLSDEAISLQNTRGNRPAYELPPEEWIREFKAWTASHSDITAVLPDEAMERESIYSDRGL